MVAGGFVALGGCLLAFDAFGRHKVVHRDLAGASAASVAGGLNRTVLVRCFAADCGFFRPNLLLLVLDGALACIDFSRALDGFLIPELVLLLAASLAAPVIAYLFVDHVLGGILLAAGFAHLVRGCILGGIAFCGGIFALVLNRGICAGFIAGAVGHNFPGGGIVFRVRFGVFHRAFFACVSGTLEHLGTCGSCRTSQTDHPKKSQYLFAHLASSHWI